MDYGFKPTTNGRNALAACMALGKPPDICRVAFGSGKIGEDVNLADQHTLLAYVADGAVVNRRHRDDHFYFTIQYANSEHRDVETFYIGEFIVYIRDPATGEETDLLYGTMGDYQLPVPKYSANVAPAVFDLPLVIVVSDDVNVEVTAPPGLVTWDEMDEAIRSAMESSPGTPQTSAGPPKEDTPGIPGQHYFDTESGAEYVCKGTTEEGKTVWEPTGNVYRDTPPTEDTSGVQGQHYFDTSGGVEYVCVRVNADGTAVWEKAGSAAVEDAVTAHNADRNAHADIRAMLAKLSGGAAVSRVSVIIPADGWEAADEPLDGCGYICDVAVESVTADHWPVGGPDRGSVEAARKAGFGGCETAEGYLRFYAEKVPEADITATITLIGAGTAGGGTGGTGSIPVASSSTLGGVKVQANSGLKIDSEGNLAVDTPTREEAAGAIEDAFEGE